MEALLAGDAHSAEALAAALRGREIDVRLWAAGGFAGSLREIERELERSRPEVAVAVGSTDGALALAITAAKAEVPVAHVSSGPEREDASRALSTLAGLDAGADPTRAADLIQTWIRGDQPPANLK